MRFSGHRRWHALASAIFCSVFPTTCVRIIIPGEKLVVHQLIGLSTADVFIVTRIGLPLYAECVILHKLVRIDFDPLGGAVVELDHIAQLVGELTAHGCDSSTSMSRPKMVLAVFVQSRRRCPSRVVEVAPVAGQVANLALT